MSVEVNPERESPRNANLSVKIDTPLLVSCYFLARVAAVPATASRPDSHGVPRSQQLYSWVWTATAMGFDGKGMATVEAIAAGPATAMPIVLGSLGISVLSRGEKQHETRACR